MPNDLETLDALEKEIKKLKDESTIFTDHHVHLKKENQRLKVENEQFKKDKDQFIEEIRKSEFEADLRFKEHKEALNKQQKEQNETAIILEELSEKYYAKEKILNDNRINLDKALDDALREKAKYINLQDQLQESISKAIENEKKSKEILDLQSLKLKDIQKEKSGYESLAKKCKSESESFVEEYHKLKKQLDDVKILQEETEKRFNEAIDKENEVNAKALDLKNTESKVDQKLQKLEQATMKYDSQMRTLANEERRIAHYRLKTNERMKQAKMDKEIEELENG